MRDTPCAARGAEPLAFCSWRWGVAGRVDLPAEVGSGGPKGRRQGGVPPSRRSIVKSYDFEGRQVDRYCSWRFFVLSSYSLGCPNASRARNAS